MVLLDLYFAGLNCGSWGSAHWEQAVPTRLRVRIDCRLHS